MTLFLLFLLFSFLLFLFLFSFLRKMIFFRVVVAFY